LSDKLPKKIRITAVCRRSLFVERKMNRPATPRPYFTLQLCAVIILNVLYVLPLRQRVASPLRFNGIAAVLRGVIAPRGRRFAISYSSSCCRLQYPLPLMSQPGGVSPPLSLVERGGDVGLECSRHSTGYLCPSVSIEKGQARVPSLTI
jgi:hypothetical protein